MDFLTFLIINIIRILKYAILVRILMSWFQPLPQGRISQTIFDITEPILRIFRNLLPKTGMIDFSPLLAFLLLDFLQIGAINLLQTF